MITPHLTCPRCEGVELEHVPDSDGSLVATCPRCRATLVEAGDLESVFGGPLPAPHDVGLPNPFAHARAAELGCPVCREGKLVALSVGELDVGVHRCETCGAHLFDATAYTAVLRMSATGEAHRISTFGLELDESAMTRNRPPRRKPTAESPMEAIRGPSPVAPSEPSTPVPTLSREERRALLDTGDPHLGSTRLPYDEPWSTLLTLPLCLLLGVALSAIPFGRLLAMPMRIQFHELGHALPAWLSGRMAVPLPCGFTFWSEETSPLTHLLVLAFSASLVVLGLRERRYFSVVIAVCIELLHFVFSVVLTESATMRLVLLDGCAGEMWIAGFVLVSFYFRAPDRFRWDFFRFLFVVPAAITLVDSLHMWIAVRSGVEAAPVGSIMGTVGDGTGDLERLMNDHGYALEALVRGYVSFGVFVLVLVLFAYGVHAIGAARKLAERAR